MTSDQNQIKVVKEMIESAENTLRNARSILAELSGDTISAGPDAVKAATENTDFQVSETDTEKIIEGVFDGEKMLGPDGRAYPVPHNYASKSKLVPGDLLKLTIAQDGRFIYKNIGPIDRTTTIGTLTYDNGHYKVITDEGKAYKILTASVTFFKAEAGDHLAIIIPSQHDSSWAAVEALITQPVESMNPPSEIKPEEIESEDEEKPAKSEKPKKKPVTKKKATKETPKSDTYEADETDK